MAEDELDLLKFNKTAEPKNIYPLRDEYKIISDVFGVCHVSYYMSNSPFLFLSLVLSSSDNRN